MKSKKEKKMNLKRYDLSQFHGLTADSFERSLYLIVMHKHCIRKTEDSERLQGALHSVKDKHVEVFGGNLI